MSYRLSCLFIIYLLSASVGLAQEVAKPKVSNSYRHPIAEGVDPVDASEKALARFASERALSLQDFQLQRTNLVGQGERRVFVYTQSLNGYLVEGATVRILVRESSPSRATYISAKIAALPIGGFPAEAVTASTALNSVRLNKEFARLTTWSAPERVIIFSEGLEGSSLVWKFTGANAAAREGYNFFVSTANGSLLRQESLVIHEEVTGHIKGKITPGLLPATTYNPAVIKDLDQIPVSLANGPSTYTDSSGNYSLPYSETGAVTVKTNLVGEWVTVFNEQGAELALEMTVTPPATADFFYNQTPTQFNTAQMNGFVQTTYVHDFYKQYQPDFAAIDISLPCYVNVVDTCNAFFSFLGGVHIGFYHAAGGCANTAYTTVVGHEYGHFIVNQLGLIQEAFGEGFGDSLTILAYDTPINGQDFFGQNTFVRNLSTPDIQWPCSGDSHYCGQVLAGVWWDIREKIGLEPTRQLFTDWSQIANGNIGIPLGEQIMAVDDDDDDFSNGTPHLTDICAALALHGISCGQDCNTNGIFDGVDIGSGSSADCNANGIPDECDLPQDPELDCNGNGIIDICEINQGLVADCNANGIPDECEPLAVYHEWVQTVGGPTQFENNQGVAVSSLGEVFVLGYFYGAIDFDPSSGVDVQGSPGTQSVFVTKFAADGSYKWTRTWASGVFPKDIALDTNDDVFVLGVFSGSVDFDPTAGMDIRVSQANSDVFVVKLHSDGSYVWTQTISGAGQKTPNALATSRDNASGRFFILGIFNASTDFDPTEAVDFKENQGSADIFVSQFSTDGAYQGTQVIGGPGFEEAVSIRMDLAGNILFTGNFGGTIDFDPGSGVDLRSSQDFSDGFLTKWNADGSYAWTQVFSNGITFTSFAPNLAMDSSGNAYLTGSFSGSPDFDPGIGVDIHASNGGSDIFLTKIYSNGSYAWTQTFGSVSSQSAPRVVVGSIGEIVLAGEFQGSVDFDPSSGTEIKTSKAPNSPDIFISKFNAEGSYKGVEAFGGIFTDNCRGLAASPSNRVVISGLFKGTTDFDPSGNVAQKTSNGSLSLDVFVSQYALPNPLFYNDCNNNSIFDGCEIANGTILDQNQNGIPDPCELVQGDLNSDGIVNSADLGILLSLWGSNGAGDLNGDGIVDSADLGILLSHWTTR